MGIIYFKISQRLGIYVNTCNTETMLNVAMFYNS